MLVDKVLQVRPLLILAGGDVAIVENIRSWWQNDVAKLQHDMTCGQSSSSESLNTTGVWGWFNFVIFLNSNLVDVIQAGRDLRFRLWPDDVIQALTRWCYSGCPRSRREKGCSCDNLSPDCCHQLLLQDWMDWGDIFCISFKVAIRVGQMSLCSKLFCSVLGFT